MENFQLLIIAGVIAIAGILFSNAINLLAEYARTRYAQNFAHWLRVRLLRRMASQPYTYFLQRNSGDLLKKILGDVMNYTVGVLLPLLDTVARALTAVLLLATLFLVQPVIALSAAIGLGGFYVITFRLLARKRREVDENLRTHPPAYYREAHQMLGGIKPVKVHRAEEHFLARFAGHSAIIAKMNARVSIFQQRALSCGTARFWRSRCGCVAARGERARFFRYSSEPRRDGACRLPAAAFTPVAL